MTPEHMGYDLAVSFRLTKKRDLVAADGGELSISASIQDLDTPCAVDYIESELSCSLNLAPYACSVLMNRYFVYRLIVFVVIAVFSIFFIFGCKNCGRDGDKSSHWAEMTPFGCFIIMPYEEALLSELRDLDSRSEGRIFYLDNQPALLELVDAGGREASSLINKIQTKDLFRGGLSIRIDLDTLCEGEVQRALNLKEFEKLSIGIVKDGFENKRLADCLSDTGAKELFLQFEKADDETIREIAQVKNIRQLHLFMSDGVTDVGLTHASRMKKLIQINVGATAVTDTGLKHISRLKNLQDLELPFLNLRNKSITDKGISHLSGLKKLKRIDIQDSSVTNDGLANLSEMKELIHLDLHDTKVTNAGLAHVSEMKNLRVLLLSDGITDEGLAHISVLKNLMYIYPMSDSITDKGLAYLSTHAQLRYLHLSNTKVTDAGLAHISKCAKLETLIIDNTNVTDNGIAHLAGLEKLKELNLSGTKITDAALVYLKGLKALRNLKVANTKVTRDAATKYYEDVGRGHMCIDLLSQTCEIIP